MARDAGPFLASPLPARRGLTLITEIAQTRVVFIVTYPNPFLLPFCLPFFKPEFFFFFLNRI